MWYLWGLLLSVVVFVVGYVTGVTSSKYLERKELRRIEDEERQRQESVFKALEDSEKKAAQSKKREKLVKTTKDALDFGYTIQQIVIWAYAEIFFDDVLPAQRAYTESQADAEKRRKNERYSYIQKVLFGLDDHPALQDRNILAAMQKASILPGNVPQNASLESQEK